MLSSGAKRSLQQALKEVGSGDFAEAEKKLDKISAELRSSDKSWPPLKAYMALVLISGKVYASEGRRELNAHLTQALGPVAAKSPPEDGAAAAAAAAHKQMEAPAPGSAAAAAAAAAGMPSFEPVALLAAARLAQQLHKPGPSAASSSSSSSAPLALFLLSLFSRLDPAAAKVLLRPPEVKPEQSGGKSSFVRPFLDVNSSFPYSSFVCILQTKVAALYPDRPELLDSRGPSAATANLATGAPVPKTLEGRWVEARERWGTSCDPIDDLFGLQGLRKVPHSHQRAQAFIVSREVGALGLLSPLTHSLNHCGFAC